MVHFTRLKNVTVQEARLLTKLVHGLGHTHRLYIDKVIMPEDISMPYNSSSRYEFEAIIDDETTRLTTTDRSQRKFLGNWVGYNKPTWEPLTNLSCGV